MANETATCRWRRRLAILRQDQAFWKPHWRELVDYFLPRKGRYLAGESLTQDNDGRKKHSKVINGTPASGLRTLAAGLHGGLTSPSRPWFALTLPDEKLAEYDPVRDWLHQVRQGMLQVFARSNFYGAIHSEYQELGGFGTGAMMVEEDPRSLIRCRPFTIGEYCLALDSRYRPESLYRQFSMSAYQMREAFGEEKLPTSVSGVIATQPDRRFEIVHVVERNDFVDPAKADRRGMAYRSVYFPLDGDEHLILREGGYRTIPFVAPRWDATGVDTYGSSPAMAALGDVKMLQTMELRKLKALEKMVDPPMVGPTSMKNATGIAGGITYLDVADGRQGFSPAYQVKPDLQDLAYEMDRVERRVKDGFYNDLFLAVLGEEKQMTAHEVARRYEEKLMMLGPVLERLQSELMDPVIDRVFSIMFESGALPPPPQDLPTGMPINVEYIGLLAQAQKMVGTSAIEQATKFAVELAAGNPEALDKIDIDEAIDQYATALGVPPRIVRSDDKVKALRAARQQAMMNQKRAEMAPAVAGAVKDLATSPVRGGSTTAMDALMGAAGRPAAGPA